MKKNGLVIGFLLLIVLFIILFAGGKSLAKYMSTSTTNVSTQVAKWNISDTFLVNGKAVTSTPINLASTYDVSRLTNGKIAPGTSGNFTIKINATGTDTGLDYRVTFTNISTPNIDQLRYTYKGTTYSSLAALQKVLTGRITAEAISKNATLEIGWEWPYETLDSNKSSKVGDAKDLELAQNSSKFGFDVNVICTQISPITEKT